MPFHRSIADILREPGREWTPGAPASDEAIVRLRQAAPCELPPEYIELLRYCESGEGPFDGPGLWFMLHPVNDSLESNRMWADMGAYQDFWFFGSNGGLEAIGFDLRQGPPWSIVMIDCIAGEESAERIASEMGEFIEKIGREGDQLPV
jgi:hypothetical protein